MFLRSPFFEYFIYPSRTREDISKSFKDFFSDNDDEYFPNGGENVRDAAFKKLSEKIEALRKKACEEQEWGRSNCGRQTGNVEIIRIPFNII